MNLRLIDIRQVTYPILASLTEVKVEDCSEDELTLLSWVYALENRQSVHSGHSWRVVDPALQMAGRLRFSGEQVEKVRWGALAHDVGKLLVPEAILLKPGQLNPTEWAFIKRHPQYSRYLLSQISFMRGALEIPYAHHESWDGSGYPLGLAGKQIPLAARFFAIVDVWDALTHDRPYRPAWDPERALTYLVEQSGRRGSLIQRWSPYLSNSSRKIE